MYVLSRETTLQPDETHLV